jgi:hypothetical protein
VPDSTHRLHFFSKHIALQDLWTSKRVNQKYLGYVIIRPNYTGLVARAMLAPPNDLAPYVRTSVKDTVNLFGKRLTVRAVPFAQQNAQLGACAQVSVWACHYSAYLRGDVGRRSLADFTLHADPSLSRGRQLPTNGLTVEQISHLFATFGLPPIVYDLREFPDVPALGEDTDELIINLDETALSSQAMENRGVEDSPNRYDNAFESERVATRERTEETTSPHTRTTHPDDIDNAIAVLQRAICRYLHSGYPIIVGTEDHAFVLCGYERHSLAGAEPTVSFVRHDDRTGPYRMVHDIANDRDEATKQEYGMWRYLIVPLPDKLWLLPEAAEKAAGGSLLVISDDGILGPKFARDSFQLNLKSGKFFLKTYAIESSRFKAALSGRRLPAEVIEEYRLARFSRYVWVVEIFDRDLAKESAKCVVGEVIYDATSSDHDPLALAIHVPGAVWMRRTEDSAIRPKECAIAAYSSGSIQSA